MKKGVSSRAVYRKDYAPYPWTLESVSLHFSIEASATLVRCKMLLQQNNGLEEPSPLVLDGKDLELKSICIDGVALDSSRYRIEGEHMIISDLPPSCVLESEVLINPAANTALEGLYQAGEFLLTQCEAEGFRLITWFPDRPDVMTRYEVRLEADATQYPVLLSNGNLVDSGTAEGGRHWVRWDDPFPKPSYLFALVAGDLAHVEDHFVTHSGRDVTLRVYVDHGNLDRCEHAMESLINAMRWDEERFDLEYDLDIYNIVATDAFNMGAMENKSLNIFNSKYVLARPDAATDRDYQGIEGVIGHEYFHNWTGNRVTCQDWFQLTLKEGLTVFRDEEFSADMQSRAAKRIESIRDLRNRQFPEDAGPMAHPIRPDKYVEINNFYTATVYEKGAAVIRMYHTLLGEEGFQAGMNLYFERHDGQAVTCDDFLAGMADANGRDLSGFSRWYSQSGTPEVTVAMDHDRQSGRLELTLSQHTPPTPDQPEKRPLVIPFALGLINADGKEVALKAEGHEGEAQDTCLLLLESESQTFRFNGIHDPVVPSLLRDFSAPVKVHYDWTTEDLSHLIKHDQDVFARWEAAQTLAQRCILEQVQRAAEGKDMQLEPALAMAFEGLLNDHDADPVLVAESMTLPAELYLAEQMSVVDVDGIHKARKFVRHGLARALEGSLRARYQALNNTKPYSKKPSEMARRSLKNICLSYLAGLPGGEDMAQAQLAASDNMTDTLAALRGLVFTGAASADKALAEFESAWLNDSLVMDKWFAIQAINPGPKALARVRELMQHPKFNFKKPNKVRSLIGAFCFSNPTGFHTADGSGYRFLADQVLALDSLNPQMAARMASAFNRWKRYDSGRKNMMQQSLETIAEHDSLSPDVSEIVSNALS